MSALKQILAVSAMGLRSIPQRPGPSLVIVISIAGAVAVLAAVLAMSSGLNRAMAEAGRPDRVLVLRTGSGSEIASALTRDAIEAISAAPGVAHAADGKPLVSAESVGPFSLVDRGSGSDVSATIRGFTAQSLAVWSELQVVQGRMFHPGLAEIVVGKQAHLRYQGLNLGDSISMYGVLWKVVGIFEAAGNSRESELITDAETVMAASHSDSYQSASVLLITPAAFDVFRKAATANPALTIEAFRERDFLAAESRSMDRLLSFIAYGVGGVMALGALFAALNAMYSAVKRRTREIATLRAVGFRPQVIVPSVIAEAVLLGLAGGVLGAGIVWLIFNGHTVSTVVGSAAPRQLSFPLIVDSRGVAIDIACACIIGAVGGLFPAIRASRVPVTKALRAT
jgi:putative ABC transport system permease protein